jgi:hypothetical protein
VARARSARFCLFSSAGWQISMLSWKVTVKSRMPTSNVYRLRLSCAHTKAWKIPLPWSGCIGGKLIYVATEKLAPTAFWSTFVGLAAKAKRTDEPRSASAKVRSKKAKNTIVE